MGKWDDLTEYEMNMWHKIRWETDSASVKALAEKKLDLLRKRPWFPARRRKPITLEEVQSLRNRVPTLDVGCKVKALLSVAIDAVEKDLRGNPVKPKISISSR